MLVHPALDTSDAAYSFEVEPEVTDLASPASTVYLTPSLTAQFRIMLAYEMGRVLGRDAAWLAALVATMPERKLMDKWLSDETARGEMLKGGTRRA
jgi:hypothetical protein